MKIYGNVREPKNWAVTLLWAMLPAVCLASIAGVGAMTYCLIRGLTEAVKNISIASVAPWMAYAVIGACAILGSKRKEQLDFSKRIINDIRLLLYVVTIGGLALAAYCITNDYLGSLPWLSAMVGLPWTAHGVVCSFYLNMAKSDHREGGITYELAKANGFNGVPSAGATPNTSTANSQDGAPI